MLRQVKSDLKDNYFDPAFRGLDIESTFADAEARLKKAGTVSEATAIIVDAVMRLNDSHTMFYPPARVGRVRYGWLPYVVGNDTYVAAVSDNSDAAAKGIATGDRVVGWNRFRPDRSNLRQIRYLYTFVRPQITHRLVVRKPDGAERTVDVQAAVDDRPGGDIEDLLRELEPRATIPDPMGTVGGTVLVWRMRRFGDPALVEAALKKARGYKSLVLDLRGNPGGSVATEQALLSALFDRDVTIGTLKERTEETRRVARGRKDAFAGPIVAVVDSASGSAAEVVARVLQLEKRVTVIGDRTAGAVMTARTLRHTVGLGSVALYAVSVTVGDLRMTDGPSLEGVGVTPDEVLLPTGADLAAGRDPALARAAALLGEQLSAEQAGRLYKSGG